MSLGLYAILPALRRLFTSRCRRCGERAVRNQSSLLVRAENDQGQPCCYSLSYAACGSCGDRTKRIGKGPIETPSEEEWQRDVVDHLERVGR
jgi:hypothetical protein